MLLSDNVCRFFLIWILKETEIKKTFYKLLFFILK